MDTVKFAGPMLFLSTLSLRRATGPSRGINCKTAISIHALLAESDVMHALILADAMLFLSTLSLRRATREPTALRTPHHRFLSTLSLRRATRKSHRRIRPERFLSTLSLRRATDSRNTNLRRHRNFYPRSPCGERRISSIINNIIDDFYPRSPCGERPAKHTNLTSQISISIHALLAESDSQQPDGATRTTYFYPRSPCGERQDTVSTPDRPEEFLSTLSLRRAT